MSELEEVWRLVPNSVQAHLCSRGRAESGGQPGFPGARRAAALPPALLTLPLPPQCPPQHPLGTGRA